MAALIVLLAALTHAERACILEEAVSRAVADLDAFTMNLDVAGRTLTGAKARSSVEARYHLQPALQHR
jgi:hypothetical protein